jgi:hypothetical protein
MQALSRYSSTAALVVLISVGFASRSDAQGPPVIEGMFPSQLVPGQTTVVHMGVNGRQEVAAVEVLPAAGVTVKSIARSDLRQGQGWWDVTLEVARDAAPGSRTIVATGPMLRTAPRPLTIPARVPAVSDLKITSAMVNQPTVEFQFAMTETPNDIGEAPYVYFSLACGGEPEVGVVKGKVANGIVRASIPNPRTQMKPFADPPKAHCDFEVRASDSKMADSNTLKTPVDFK